MLQVKETSVMILAKIVDRFLKTLIIQFILCNSCFSQKQDKISFISMDSLAKEPTFSKVLCKSKNGDKIYLYNINFEDPILGRIYILFNLFPNTGKKNKFWKVLNKNDIKDFRKIEVDELKDIVRTKISNYYRLKENFFSDFNIENIILFDNKTNRVSSNLYVEFFTNNLKNDNIDFRVRNYINFNVEDSTSVNDSVYIKKSRIHIPSHLSMNQSREMVLIRKIKNNIFLFNRDIFNFIDFSITPKIIKGEILKVSESFFLFESKVGIIGRTIKKQGYKTYIFYAPVRRNIR